MNNIRKILFVLISSVLLLSGCADTPAAPERQTEVQVSYEDAKVSFLGPEGTYTQEACETFFDKKGTYIPYKTVGEAVEALINGESNLAVIPQENTIGGAVIDYVDTIIAHPELSVVGEVELPINQNILVIPGAQLGDIKTVYSHKQGIAQGKAWLAENLPDAQVVEVSSTAEGAKIVSEGQDKTCAAIASAGCADVYGLDILAAGIQNNDKNRTRFYVLSSDAPAAGQAERSAFIASGAAAGLPELMAEMSSENITLITIHDRPLKTELGQYSYIIECSGGDSDSFKKMTENTGFTFRWLGSFGVK